jgi:hypothetical protein
MNKKLISGILGVLLVFEMMAIGCSNGTTDSPEYTAEWGVANGYSYSTVSSYFNPPLTPAGSDAGYLLDTDATEAYEYVKANYTLGSPGTASGSFESLMNLSVNGVVMPPTLKSELEGKKDNSTAFVGVYYFTDQSGNTGVVLFYTKKN